MAVEFRDEWLEVFYEQDQSHKKIPSTIEGALRVNKQYRLIFRWVEGIAQDTYLDPHVYRG